MRKTLLILPLLVMLLPIPAQPNFGIAVGDSFTFTLSQWDVTEDGKIESVATVEDNGLNPFTLREGDSFTVTIISIDEPYISGVTSYDVSSVYTTAILDQQTSTQTSITTVYYTTAYTTTVSEPDYYPILVEYSSGSQTVQSYVYSGWGGFIVEPDWDLWKEMLNSSDGYTDSSDSITIIDTADEFGIRSSSTYSDSYGDYTYNYHHETEIRYKKSDGVITYLHSEGTNEYSDATKSETSSTKAEIYRSGYSPSNTNGDLSLPAFQFGILMAALVVSIPIRRRFLG